MDHRPPHIIPGPLANSPPQDQRRTPSSQGALHGNSAWQPQGQQPAPFPPNPYFWAPEQRQQPYQRHPLGPWNGVFPPLRSLEDGNRFMRPGNDAPLPRAGPEDLNRRRFNPLPALVMPSSLGPSDRNCPICKTRYGEIDPPDSSEFEYPIKLQCGHVYGHFCIDEWLQESLLCPLCNATQDFDMGPERGESAREAASREEWRRADTEIQVKRRTRRSSEEVHVRGRSGGIVGGRSRGIFGEPSGSNVRERSEANSGGRSGVLERRSRSMENLERFLQEMQFIEYKAAGFDQMDAGADERLARKLQSDAYQDATADDERLARRLQLSANQNDTAGDERMARKLHSDARQDQNDTAGDEQMARKLQVEWGQDDESPGDSEAEARMLEAMQLQEFTEGLERLALEEWQRREFQRGW